MNLWPSILRELRSESRRGTTYGIRALGGGVVCAIFLVVSLMTDLPPGSGGLTFFTPLNWTVTFCLWLVCPVIAADCIASERREGTLGLLFLTPLTPREVVWAKAFVHLLRSFGILLAITPILLILFTLGGVGWQDALTILGSHLGEAMAAIGAGILASSLFKGPLTAIVFSLLFAIPLFLMFVVLNGVCFWFFVGTARAFHSYWVQTFFIYLLASLLILRLCVIAASRRLNLFWREEPAESGKIRRATTSVFRFLLWLGTVAGAVGLGIVGVIEQEILFDLWHAGTILLMVIAGPVLWTYFVVQPVDAASKRRVWLPVPLLLPLLLWAAAGAAVLAFDTHLRWEDVSTALGVQLWLLGLIGAACLLGSRRREFANTLVKTVLLMIPALLAALVLTGITMESLKSDLFEWLETGLEHFIGAGGSWGNPDRFLWLAIAGSAFCWGLAGVLTWSMSRKRPVADPSLEENPVQELMRTFGRPRVGTGWFRFMREALLRWNPLAWLHVRSLGNRVLFWLSLSVVLVFEGMLLASGYRHDVDEVNLTLLAGMALVMAFSAATSYQQDKKSGCLELIVVTRLTVGQIVWGRPLCIWMTFLAPVSLVMFMLFQVVSGEVFLLLLAIVLVTFFALVVFGTYCSLRFRNLVSSFFITLVAAGLVPLGLFALTAILLEKGSQQVIFNIALMLLGGWQCFLGLFAAVRLRQALLERKYITGRS